MTNDINRHLENRRFVASALIREVFGPGGRYVGWPEGFYANGVKIDPANGLVFESWDEYSKRYIDASSGEEILKDESPSRRYGVGILFPEEDAEMVDADKAPADADAAVEGTAGMTDRLVANQEELSANERRQAKKLAQTQERMALVKEQEEDILPGEDSELDGLKLARLRRPRSMGITFLVDCVEDSSLKITVEGGRYPQIDNIKIKNQGGKVLDREHRWWIRSPVAVTIELTVADLKSAQCLKPISLPMRVPNMADLNLRLEIRSRPAPDSVRAELPQTARFVTVSLVNRSKVTSKSPADCLSLFQSRFLVQPAMPGSRILLPLPRPRRGKDEEEQTIDLLYRNCHAFAAGHGCAGDWIADEGATAASCVIAEPIPCHQTPPVTPNLIHPRTSKPFVLPMLPLARGNGDWLEPLKDLAELYKEWIKERSLEAATLDNRYKPAADRHLETATRCLARIEDGLRLLEENQAVALAFRLANEAVLLQQLAGKAKLRRINYDAKTKRIIWDREPRIPDLSDAAAAECAWRPFQIAFLLMSLKGLWDGKSDDRHIADLIWFPTGGGKTEAYLGATAFLLFARRLQNKDDCGTGVLMRYTLRLLTSQQFQRAAGLICAMEVIRRKIPEQVGTSEFRIGIWLGSETTPNWRIGSVTAYNEAKFNGPEKYSHIMLRCPWCGSQMGPRKRFWSKFEQEPGDSPYAMEGLEPVGAGKSRTIKIHCPDNHCTFANALPVSVVDEEIYENPPALVIATVDKFAMLAWNPKARAIFGLGMDGTRRVSPPGLIIQDELHLITGPLGSMVGLYEGVIEELCSDRRNGGIVRPKLIASTATTRASTRQISDLYARERTAVFPPPGLEVGDAFFATYERDDEGLIKPGRMYLGVLARAYGSGLTVNVRVFSALLAAAARLPQHERDPWWTLLVFYNSLRELGSNLTLFGADIPERLRDLGTRWHPAEKRRFMNEVLELTGRLSNSEVPRALEALERTFENSASPVDACLASNIIEVGIDVPRLALMAVAGQPKNTAQYIQVTGRVGRSRPGLVIIDYDNRKPRDLSHFEHFRDYHERLYAAVEPASVTPFTIQLMERALHGTFIAWCRQQLPESEQSNPRSFGDSNSKLYKSFLEFAENYKKRLHFLFRSDPVALRLAENVLATILKRRQRDWKSSSPIVWSNADMMGISGDIPLMRRYGEPCKTEWEEQVWCTPTSMRGVDVECPADVYKASLETPSTETIDVAEDPLDQIFR